MSAVVLILHWIHSSKPSRAIHQLPLPSWSATWVCSATDAFAALLNRRSCQKLECRRLGCMRDVPECHRRHQHITLLIYHARPAAFEKPPPTQALLICYVWPCRVASWLNPTIRLVADRYRDEANLLSGEFVSRECHAQKFGWSERMHMRACGLEKVWSTYARS